MIKHLLERLVKVKNIEILALALILSIGFSLRLYKINAPIADWHSFRQADTASVTRYMQTGEGSLFYPKYHDISRVQSGMDNPEGFRYVELPIYNFITAKLFQYVGIFNLEVWGRLVSILCALATASLLFLLGKRYISPVGGLLATLFYLFLPFNIYFTRTLLPEPMAVFLGVLALFLFSEFIERKSNSYLLASAFIFALAILVKPYIAFYGVPIGYLALSKYKLRNILANLYFVSAFTIVVLPFFAWRYFISAHPEGIPFWAWTFNGDGIRFKPAFWYWILGERLGKLILGFLGILPFAVGIMATDVKRRFLHYFALGMLLYVSTIATANVKHDYYQVLIIPMVALVVSWGSIKLWYTKDLNQKVARFVLIIALGVMFMTGAMQVREFYKINHPEIIEAGKMVDKLTPNDALIIASYNGDTAFLYHTKRRGWPVVELPIDELIAKGASYFVSVNLNDRQTIEFIERFETVSRTNSYVLLKLK